MNTMCAILAALVTAASGSIQASTMQPAAWPATDRSHRAMFCGYPGHEEISLYFAEALLKEIRRLEATGLVDAQVQTQLARQASCDTPAAAD